jgi:hypothetical protein
MLMGDIGDMERTLHALKRWASASRSTTSARATPRSCT